MKLRIKYICLRCNGRKNQGATDACSSCFSKGYIEEIIEVEEFEVLDENNIYEALRPI